MRKTRQFRSVWCLIACLFLSGSVCADKIFEDRFEQLDRWELADKGGGSSMSLQVGHSVPEPYGPAVLSLRGEYAMALVRDLVVTDCTVTTLWRDIEPEDYDADGVLAAAGIETVVLGPGDIALAHGPNEAVPIGELGKAAQLYANVTLHLLG